MKSIAMFRNVIVLAALGASAGLALAAPAEAAPSTTINVAASVASNCLMSSSSAGLNFGSYDPTDTSPKTTTTTFKVRCTKNAPYTIGLNSGIGAGATELARKMSLSGQASMDYAVYSDAAREINWGSTGLLGAATGIGNGLAMNNEMTITVYGRIRAEQTDVGVGNYSDTLTATVSY